MAAIKYILLVTLVVLFSSKGHAQTNAGFPAIIPLPAEVKPTGNVFHITPATVIICRDTMLTKTAGLLNLYLEANGIKPLVVKRATAVTNCIEFKIDTVAVTNAEGYSITVDNNDIRLTGRDAGGIIYAIETLRQLWYRVDVHSLTVAGCVINDHPRFAYRGMGLDVSRHLFPVSFIKKYIDLLALYKFNTFRWHLTDDQGWRIEIKKYPKLQSIAAWRDETLIGHKKELPQHLFDGKRYGGYYTQEAIKDIVQYALQRNITIIPEIEMPGHAQAALAAYPQLGCTGGPYKTATFWGVFDDVFCAGNDSTFTFLQNVLDEVMELFPSKYIHIGGDECPTTRWKVCSKCQQRITAMHLKDEHELQSYFIQRIEKYINSKGKNIIGWDEILEGGLAPNATVMSWRGEEGGIAAAKQKHSVIMTPESFLYFDYYQSLSPDEPLAAGNYTPLSKVYNYEPVLHKMDTADSYFIKGVEGEGWSEYFTSESKVEYMVFPRAIALAEVAWSQPVQHNYNDFLERLRLQLGLLKQLQVNYSNAFDEIGFTSLAIEKNIIAVDLQTSFPAATICFTTDDTKPSLHSNTYTSSVLLNKTSVLRAQLYDTNKKPVGREFSQRFIVHKAIGKPVTLLNPAYERFNPGAAGLVNGVEGNTRYNTGQWLGFGGNNMEAVIDLQSTQTVQSVAMNFLNYHWQRMWAPVSLDIYVSADSMHFEKVFTQNKFPINGINTVKASIQPVAARYIKVIAVNKGIIPPGEYGEGHKALLLVDEIIVH